MCKVIDKNGMSNALIERYVREEEEADKLLRRLNQTSYGGPSRVKNAITH